MKKLMLGALFSLILGACSGASNTDEETIPVDSVAVIELETATEDVETGLKNLEENVNQLSSDVDSLLNGI